MSSHFACWTCDPLHPSLLNAILSPPPFNPQGLVSIQRLVYLLYFSTTPSRGISFKSRHQRIYKGNFCSSCLYLLHICFMSKRCCEFLVNLLSVGPGYQHCSRANSLILGNFPSYLWSVSVASISHGESSSLNGLSKELCCGIVIQRRRQIAISFIFYQASF